MDISTADLCDAHADELQIAEPGLVTIGGAPAFGGPIATVQVLEDNVLVRQALEEPGQGRVLVIDGGGSLRCALIGDMLATLARDNGWAGVIVNGCVRDSRAIGTLEVGVMALATTPARAGSSGKDRETSRSPSRESPSDPGRWSTRIGTASWSPRGR